MVALSRVFLKILIVNFFTSVPVCLSSIITFRVNNVNRKINIFLEKYFKFMYQLYYIII